MAIERLSKAVSLVHGFLTMLLDLRQSDCRVLFTMMLLTSVRAISTLYEQPIGCDFAQSGDQGPPMARSTSKIWYEGYKAGCTQFLQNYIPDHRDGKSLVIGIAGGSGSGKTTIKDVIVEQLSPV